MAFATLPRKSSFRPLLPLEPITPRSYFLLFAKFALSEDASPYESLPWNSRLFFAAIFFASDSTFAASSVMYDWNDTCAPGSDMGGFEGMMHRPVIFAPVGFAISIAW